MKCNFPPTKAAHSNTFFPLKKERAREKGTFEKGRGSEKTKEKRESPNNGLFSQNKKKKKISKCLLCVGELELFFFSSLPTKYTIFTREPPISYEN
jgi:hypothetical protein